MKDELDLDVLVEDYNEYVSRLPLGCLVIAESLREGNITAALVSIENFTEGVTWLIAVNKYLETQGIITEIKQENLNSYLLEINDGLGIQDCFLVADIFEYELIPYFKGIQKLS